MNAHKNNDTSSSPHIKAVRKSRRATFVVAAVIVVSLVGAAAFVLADSHGNVQGNTAFASQTVQIKQAGEDITSQVQELAQNELVAEKASKKAAEERSDREMVEKAAEEARNMANQERIARVKAEQEKRVAEKKATQEKTEQERIA